MKILPKKKNKRKPVTSRFTPRVRRFRGEPREVLVRKVRGKEKIKIRKKDLRRSR